MTTPFLYVCSILFPVMKKIVVLLFILLGLSNVVLAGAISPQLEEDAV